MSSDNLPSSRIDWQKMDALHEAEEIVRRKEAILRSDTEKFFQFTKMIRVNNTLKKAEINSKKSSVKSMAVDNLNVLDFVSIDKEGNVVLTISDHLEWDSENEHLLILQNKINIYLGSIENGSLYESYPNAKNRDIIISIIAKYPPNEAGKIFIEQAKNTVESAKYKFSFSIHNVD